MTERKTFPWTSIVAVFVTVFALLGAYVSGYFWLSEFYDETVPQEEVAIERYYERPWMATCFAPAARLEAKLRQGTVTIAYPNDSGEIQELVIEP